MDVQQPPPDIQRPRRLLHVPSMTSLTWDEAALRSNSASPPYNILSYTWGRFVAVEDDPALPVHGISWNIPAIQPAHFTVDAFKQVLQSTAHEQCGYLWLDVACLDQENLAIKMDEIGKQADYFRGAHEAFIWLSRLDQAVLEGAQQMLNSLDDKLLSSEIDISRLTWNHTQLDAILQADINHTLDAVSEVLSDPWFSSLWALQEANLREDAFILSRSGQRSSSVLRPKEMLPMRLSNFTGAFQDIFVVLAGLAASHTPENPANLVREFTSLMERSGLLTINLGMEIPLHVYPAAHYRSCTRELDRVYAIMQVYHLQLGSSRAPDQQFTLEELEDELAETLNHISPIAAQLFIHRGQPKPGKAWRITANCTLPAIYYMAYATTKDCTIAAPRPPLCTAVANIQHKYGPVFTGRLVSLPLLIDFWTASIHQREQQRRDWWLTKPEQFHHYQVNIDLDANHFPEDSIKRLNSWRMASEPSKICGCDWCVQQYSSQATTDDGLEKLARLLPLGFASYSVLLIGGTTLYNLTGLHSGYTVNAGLGILGTIELLSTQASGHPVFRRLGLCSWEAAYGELKQMYEKIWLPGQLELS